MRQRRNRFGTHNAGLRRRLKWGVVFCTVLCAMSSVGIATYHARNMLPPSLTKMGQPPQSYSQGTIMPDTWQSGRRTLLLIGTDARPGEVIGNADVLMLCSLDQTHRRIELLSIPRDTKILCGIGRSRKINSVMQQGGPEEAVQTISQLLSVPIDNYVLVHFSGIVQLVDALGGVDIDVHKRMYTRTGDKQYGIINLRPGRQHLNGEQALGFIRYRHDELGDIGRTQRQQAFMKAMMQQATRPKNLVHLPSTVIYLYGALETDINVLDGVRLAASAKAFAGDTVVSGTLPGSFHDPNPNLPGDASYWIVNASQAQAVAKDLLEHGIAVIHPVQDLSITANWHRPQTTATNNLDTTPMHTDSAMQNSGTIPDSTDQVQDSFE
jgi:polyisoprenyl-teichoic acid--peptidoglycan teichoic acid transferase